MEIITFINFLSIVAGAACFFIFEDKGAGAAVSVFTILAVQFYFLPVRIAKNRQHPNLLPILVLTIAGGWTGFLWIVALVWSLYTFNITLYKNGKYNEL
jgi:hypothetical protein